MLYSVYGLDGALLHREEETKGRRTDYLRLGGEPVARVTARSDGTEELRYQHADHLGSPAAETRADGALRWREAYTPYGEALEGSGLWNDRPGFTGHVRDRHSGLTYMQITMSAARADPVDCTVSNAVRSGIVHGSERTRS